MRKKNKTRESIKNFFMYLLLGLLIVLSVFSRKYWNEMEDIKKLRSTQIKVREKRINEFAIKTHFNNPNGITWIEYVSTENRSDFYYDVEKDGKVDVIISIYGSKKRSNPHITLVYMRKLHFKGREWIFNGADKDLEELGTLKITRYINTKK